MALGMTVEFRCVHALDIGHPGLVLALMLHPHIVFEHIDTLGQVIDVEV